MVPSPERADELMRDCNPHMPKTSMGAASREDLMNI